jgi:predicted Zn-dependent protease
MRNKITAILMASGLIASLMAISCSVMEEGAGIFDKVSKIVTSDKETVSKTTKAVRSSFGDISEEEEYYIGRAVSAIILSRYSVYNDDALNKYINKVGKAVVFHSERPETYAGYHFLILDTEEVNALSAPSGFIFISKGLLKRCEDEDMLGCILAHEVGHVQKKHGLQAIKNSRLVDAFTLIGQKAVEKYGPEKLNKITNIFEGALSDIAEKLIERGYDRKYEYEADRLSVKIAARTGYDPSGLVGFLRTMEQESSQKEAKGWFKTHPSAGDRIKRAQKEISSLAFIPEKAPARSMRFNKAVQGLK